MTSIELKFQTSKSNWFQINAHAKAVNSNKIHLQGNGFHVFAINLFISNQILSILEPAEQGLRKSAEVRASGISGDFQQRAKTFCSAAAVQSSLVEILENVFRLGLDIALRLGSLFA